MSYDTVTYYDPIHKNHSRLNRKLSRLYYWLIYIWNSNVLKKPVCKIEPWISVSFGHVEHNNFGDDINMFFLRKISSDCILPGHAFSYPQSITFRGLSRYTPIYAIGSVLHLIDTNNAIVWGTGLLSESFLPSVSKLDIRAVRGPLTRKVLLSNGYDCPSIYGDPALLLPFFYNPPKIKKKFKLGIIPHYVDQDKSELEKFKNDESIKIIRMSGYRRWKDIIDQILSCEFVASSSLHGIIIAEAYQIPNLWVEIREPIVSDEGRRFKFHDFFQSIGLDRDAPYCITKDTTTTDIYEHIHSYIKAPGIDLKPLVNVCPFRIKNSILKQL